MTDEKQKGISLLETLISAAILLMVSAAVLILFQSSMQEYRFRSSVSETIKSNFTALNKIANELKIAECIYCPDKAAYAKLKSNSDKIEYGYMPASPDKSLCFNVKVSADENRVVGYYVDNIEGSIKRVLFDEGANEDPATWKVTDPSTQITVLGFLQDVRNFQYGAFNFKFDKDYRTTLGNYPDDPDNHYTQIMDIGIVINRKEGLNLAGYYPMDTKVWLERNKGIYTPLY
ncbi:MAG: type II secretion system protein [Armatimonadota bacterium]